MTAQEIRKVYLKFFEERGHAVIPRAQLVPQNDPTTLFTGSGMQPLIPYLLGQPHPAGTRLVDSQTVLRAQDIEEIGDNRHTTFFEMLGNWSLGDYFKKEQIPWFWEFMTEKIGLDSRRIYITCYIGDPASGIPKDTESANIWEGLFSKEGIDAKRVDIGSEQEGFEKGEQGGRIFFYGEKNWWCRAGQAKNMPVGEPGGPDTEMFYLFPDVQHNPKYGENCHPNCDCGRYIEVGNSVFMEYIKTKNGFEKLPKQNVDFGGGLERIAQAVLDSPDMFKISLLWPIIEELEKLSGKNYDSHTESMRVIADHLRAATFLAVDSVVPSNKEQGYVARRLLRRAIMKAFNLGIEQNFLEQVAAAVADMYKDDFPEVAEKRREVIDILSREEKIFRQTLRTGLRVFEKLMTFHVTDDGEIAHDVSRVRSGEVMPTYRKVIFADMIFQLYDTYGFPVELTLEEANLRNIVPEKNWQRKFDGLMQEQRNRSQTASKGVFKGGLADHSVETTKLHTTTHLMYEALRRVLGDHVIQRGSNVTAERTRFDFSHPQKMTDEEKADVERIVNEQIEADLTVTFKDYPTEEAFKMGAKGAFGDKYGDTVKVYTMGKPGEKPFSMEICGGPHVTHTGQLAEGGKRFKLAKEEASSAGIRRVKAILQ